VIELNPHFFHAVFDHFRSEEIRLAFPFHRNLPVVFQQDGTDGLARRADDKKERQ
jgi:hypothetical protein